MPAMLSSLQACPTCMHVYRLEDFATLDNLAKEGLALLEELQGADSAQEAFDIMGMLADVLASHGTCEQYLGWA